MRPDDYGWIVDPSHPINPKPDRESWKDLAIGIGLTLFGVIWTAVSAFSNGAHACQDAELNTLHQAGLIKDLDGNKYIFDEYDYNPASEMDLDK